MSNKLIIIPARKGSKGLPNKNKLSLGNIPLIQWSINHAIECFPEFDLMISSDDLDIIKLCNDLEIQYQIRHEGLASDTALMIDVLNNTLKFFEETNNKQIDEIILLQPTFPFRSKDDSIGFKNLINSSDFDNIISVIKVNDTHPARMYTIAENKLETFDEKLNSLNRQDLPPVFLRNGAYYCFKSHLIREGRLYGTKLVPYVMSSENKVNIDSKTDFLLAQTIFNESIKS
jgi:CMP-N-acetylneuraminic acid synthetase